MATYYADSVNGNDANPGTAPGAGNAKATASAAIALATGAGDVVEFAAGTYPLGANIAITATAGLTLRSTSGLANTDVQFTGAFSFAFSSTVKLRAINLTFKNFTGTTAPITSSNSNANFAFEDCCFDGTSSATARLWTGSSFASNAFSNCVIKNMDYVVSGGVGLVFENCKFQNIAGANGYVCTVSGNHEFIGCEFYKVKACIDLGANASTVQSDLTSFRYCTFDLKDAFSVGTHGNIYRYAAATPATVNSYRFNNNIVYRAAKIINNTSSGVLTIASSPLVKNNWIQSTVNIANYNSSGGDINTESDPLFYDSANLDYRLEPTSTAAVGNNSLGSTMGANELETPTTFFSDPGVGNVNSGTTYKYNQRTGTNRTGTLSAGLPALNVDNVKIGVDRGDGQTGTYDGSDRWTDPGEVNVRNGTAYKVNSTSNNKTGTLDLPTEANTKIGVTYDGASKTGTYDGSDRYTDPGIANVRSGTAYKSNSTSNNRTGTLDLPAESDVREDVDYDNNTKTGTLHLETTDAVSASELKVGVTKTIKDVSVTGSYDGSDRWTDPGIANVRQGSAYKANSTSNNRTGTLDLPSEANTKIGISYDGSTKTGTYDGSERYTDLPANKVADGYAYKYNTTGANNRTGTAGIEVPSTDPGEYNVLKDVAYVIDGVNKVGKYDTGESVSTDGFRRNDILKELENTLYNIRPSTDSVVYQQIVKSVSIGAGSSPELNESDMPHVQVSADESDYDHRKLAFGGSHPVVKMRVTLTVTCSPNYEPSDVENLLEDMEQAFMKNNFNLNGKAVAVELTNSKILLREAESTSEVRQFELGLLVTYIRRI